MAEELKHFGIPGMKWGIRRKRTPSVDTSSDDHRVAKTLKKKKLSEMSNEELKKLTTRLQLEKQYKDLTATETGAGKKLLNDILAETGKQVAKNYISKYATQGIDSLLATVVKKKE